MCGNVLQERIDPSLPFFTPGGSFWTNSTTELLATTTAKERQARTRNRCNGDGYESVALMPLRSGHQVVGLLQLNDSRKDCFTPEMIAFFEGIGVSIGIVLERKRVEEERDRLLNLSMDMLGVAGLDYAAALKKVNEALFREMSERKRAEQEKESLRYQLLDAQKMEAIGALAGGIAHDFNNLLTVILGFSELLIAGMDERDPSYEDLQKIHQAARNGADLVQRMLAFSRKTEINPRPLNLNREIERFKTLLTRAIPQMIQVELILSDDICTVNADAAQVEQVLMNLAVNAKDAMSDGGKLTIKTQNASLDEEYCRMHIGASRGDYVLLSVTDTGNGMDPETLSHIFEPFYTTKEMGRGTGLAIVYGIVKQHGGYITCQSALGAGTTFKIYLPVIRSESRTETSTDKPAL